MSKDEVGETWIRTEAGYVRVVLDYRSGVRRQRAFLAGALLTKERAKDLGIPSLETMAKGTQMGRG